MESVQLKQSSGGSSITVDAVKVEPGWIIKDENYIDPNDVLRKLVDYKHKKWDVTLGRLSETNQDFITNLLYETVPQFIYDSTTYDVIYKSFTMKEFGARLQVIQRAATA